MQVNSHTPSRATQVPSGPADPRAPTTQAGELIALRCLRAINYNCGHIGDLTNSYATLSGLKKGTLDGIRISLGEITKALEELQSSNGESELLHHRSTEAS